MIFQPRVNYGRQTGFEKSRYRKPTVYYKLYLTNFSNDSINLKKVEVIDIAHYVVIASISSDKENTEVSH